GIDLAIRAGDLQDSTLIGKKLGYGNYMLIASPKYINNFGEPAHPRDLKNHQCLHFTPLGFESWKLTGPKGTLNVPVPGKVIVNDVSMLRSLVSSGMGIALLPSFYCLSELKTGKLIRVLADWHTAPSPVQFVYPAQKFVSPKLSAFIEMATGPIKASLV
ncbi:MAG: substrate binding domain-containing protein, partial [Bdellovibrionaceae bacterium]|nr:substrate binding domain-containing protein [Pseudobdellovibrionaceae bacterium]